MSTYINSTLLHIVQVVTLLVITNIAVIHHMFPTESKHILHNVISINITSFKVTVSHLLRYYCRPRGSLVFQAHTILRYNPMLPYYVNIA